MIPTRCEGHDLQIIGLKTRMGGGRGGVSSMNLVLFCRASQRGWLSGRAGADVALMAVEEAVSDPDVRPRGRVA